MNGLMRRLKAGARVARIVGRELRRKSFLATPSKLVHYRATARLLCAALMLGSVPSSVLADITREVSLNPGWHLVSIPLNPTTPSPEAVFTGLPSPRRIYDYVAGQTLGLSPAPAATVPDWLAAATANWRARWGPPVSESCAGAVA